MGSDCEAGGVDQMLRLYSLVGCLRWGMTPFEDAYPNANPRAVQVLIQLRADYRCVTIAEETGDG